MKVCVMSSYWEAVLDKIVEVEYADGFANAASAEFWTSSITWSIPP